MKKILVALALAIVASTASAAVENSKHDFNWSGNNGGAYSTSQASRCMYCHVPHAAQTWGAGTALWALPDPALTLTYYTGYAITSVDARESLTCLTCHADGTTAKSQLNAALTSTAVLGTDLSNDHPIGDTVSFNPGGSGMKAGPIILAYSTYTAGGSYTMECAVCHNPHNSRTIPGRKLLAGPPGATSSTDFCGLCHTR